MKAVIYHSDVLRAHEACRADASDLIPGILQLDERRGHRAVVGISAFPERSAARLAYSVARARGAGMNQLIAAWKGSQRFQQQRLKPRAGKEDMMLSKSILISVVAIATTGLPPGTVRADESVPNIAGTYRCEPQPAPCQSGQTFTVTQKGDQIEFKSETGVAGQAKFTSRISLSGTAPWNSLGIITADNHVQWSNGTQWKKM